ncbi:putative response regulatory protein [Streptococcus parauberis]|uniref:response regulator transcription factor n=1 Tax=Streptococcus parauberis TaxID=1348 RepID=UPI000CCF2533|nr:response regulator [Streptococcus parauberis]PNY21356.1 putative response regulatory protein [Streptococcus parauberis]
MYHLLIVEDEPLIRNWLASAIDYNALQIKLLPSARDGQEGIEAIKSFQPDIVLTDIMMPIKTGFDMFEETKDYDYKKIILSSYSDFAHAKKAMSYGVFNFLEKPLNRQELKESLLQICMECEQKKSSDQVSKGNQLISDLALPEVNSSNWAYEIVCLIQENYALQLSTEDIAKKLGYSESYLYKKIKEELGITLKDYINRYRVKKAIQVVMADPRLRVYEISERVGFSDYNYFGKVFRKYTNLTFSEFKENFTQKR